MHIRLAAVALALCWPAALGAQTTQNAAGPNAAAQLGGPQIIGGPGGAPAAAAPSPEALALARTLVTKSGGGGLMTMNGLSLPLANVIKQLHLRPDQARQAMNTVLMPVLTNHTDELSEIQARSYASVLSTDTMKTAIAFYDSPAGQAFVAARGRMTRMNMQAVQSLFETLMPEFQAKADVVFKADAAPKN